MRLLDVTLLQTAALRLAAACVLVLVASAAPVKAQTEYVLSLEYQTSTGGIDNGSTGSSSGRQALAERVLAQSDAGTEIEYAIPGAQEEVRGNAMWMFPARVLVAPDGEKTVLNTAEIDRRVDEWLALANWTREVCEQWTFTWTAIQIRCGPEAIVESIEGFGMRPGPMAAGETIRLTGSAVPVALVDSGERDGMRVLTASAPIDSAEVRKLEAQTAVIVAQMGGKAITLDQAIAELDGFEAEGTVSAEFLVDAAGLVWQRIDTTELTVRGAEFGDERRTREQTVRRMTRDQWDALLAE